MRFEIDVEDIAKQRNGSAGGVDPEIDGHAYAAERQVVEGAGAVGIAALLAGKIRGDGPIVVILSGANVDMEQHLRVINGKTATRGEDRL